METMLIIILVVANIVLLLACAIGYAHLVWIKSEQHDQSGYIDIIYSNIKSLKLDVAQNKTAISSLQGMMQSYKTEQEKP